jgi:hypothetical protein
MEEKGCPFDEPIFNPEMRARVMVSPIRSKEDLQAAIKRIDQIIDAPEGSPERTELEVISVLVRDYEEKHYKIDPPDTPISGEELVKLGFEKQHMSTGYFRYSIYCRAVDIVYDHDGVVYIMMQNEYSDEYRALTHIKTIPQIKELYKALTGGELRGKKS